MSASIRRLHADALCVASDILHAITPYCDRVEIAGSLRRGTADIGDIELVVIPKQNTQESMFGEPESVSVLPEAVIQIFGKKNTIKCGEKYQKVRYTPINQPEISVDIFSATPQNYGLILALRTGSADFSHWFVTDRRKGGGCLGFVRIHDGSVYMNNVPVDVPDEQSFFTTIGLQVVPLTDRNRGYWNDRRWYI